MRPTRHAFTLLLGLAATTCALPAVAQTTIDDDRQQVQPEREDDNDAPWGLLGLLGLAGLLPQRREPDIRVDARHTKR